ncbi:hypothetical protein FACS189445_4200 [Spirochaetia bacterium]|nr:hypothetical protein FACS189445_4200 [Spirochaetia bacterium]
MLKFDHYGVPTKEEKPWAGFHPELKLNYFSSINPLFRIEYLKFAPDCIFNQEIQNNRHLAFTVDSIEETLGTLEGYTMMHPKTVVSPTLIICYIKIEDVIIELMERK